MRARCPRSQSPAGTGAERACVSPAAAERPTGAGAGPSGEAVERLHRRIAVRRDHLPTRDEPEHGREHRPPRGGDEAGGEPDVHPRHHVRDPTDPVAKAGEDLLLALAAVGDERADVGLRAVDAGAVGRPVADVVALEKAGEASHVVAHVAVRRRDDAGRPAHHVVAGEEEAVLAKREADVVRGVAGGVHALEGPPVPLDEVAVAHLDLGDELHVSPFFHLHPVLPGAVRAVAVDGARPHLRLERPGRGRVVVVGVGDEDVAHLLAGDRGGEGLHVVGEVRPRVDDRDPAPADDVGAGAVEGEGARVPGNDPPHGHRSRRGDEVDPAVLELELAPEGDLHAQFPVLLSVFLSVMARSPSTSLPAPTAIVSRSTAA